MKSRLRIEVMPWHKAREQASRIRFAVFVEEQRVPAEIELDEHDEASLHVIAFEKDNPIGTARLLPDGHIGRMAVLRDWRGKGAGALMLVTLMKMAKLLGHKEIVLSAQTHAVPFYRKHGFTEEGAEYMDAGIPHRDMRRSL
jgi:predicted GNAT family N-acyltransferase